MIYPLASFNTDVHIYPSVCVHKVIEYQNAKMVQPQSDVAVEEGDLFNYLAYEPTTTTDHYDIQHIYYFAGCSLPIRNFKFNYDVHNFTHRCS